MPEARIIIRLEHDLKAAFARAAKAADCAPSQLLRDFMRGYVRRQAKRAEYDAWLRRKVEIARKAVREGRVISSEQVEAEFAKRRREALRRARERGL